MYKCKLVKYYDDLYHNKDYSKESKFIESNATLNKVATIPHSKTIIEAWQQTEIAIKSYHVVNRNNGKFSDEKIMKKILKDE